MTRRIVITGTGTVNAMGPDVPTTLAAMREGHCAVAALDFRDVERLSIRIGAQVRGYDGAAYFDRAALATCDRHAQFALIAAREAVAAAGLGPDLGPRAGVILGNTGGGLTTQDDAYRAVYAEGRNRVHPFTVPKLMTSSASAQVSIAHGATGPVLTVATACASANHAIAQAVQTLRAGLADVVLTGGAEAMLTFGGVKVWEGLRVMSRDACRPFCATRSGMVQGEGAAVLVLETEDHARRRGAEILAEVAGVGMTADAGDLVAPSRDGAARAMRLALSDAGLDPSAIGYVNAHGTGTASNDRTECAAIADVLGAETRVPVSSTKAMHGHCIGATGAIELLACVMALRDGVIAPTVNWLRADPDCPLDVVPNEAREARVAACLSNAFAFGGLNAVLALRAV